MTSDGHGGAWSSTGFVRRLGLLVGAAALALVLGGAGYLAWPLVVRDRGPVNALPDTAAAATGATQTYTARLRDLGLRCSDLRRLSVRVCSMPVERGGATVSFQRAGAGAVTAVAFDVDLADDRLRDELVEAVTGATADALGLSGLARSTVFTSGHGPRMVEGDETLIATAPGFRPSATPAVLVSTSTSVLSEVVARGYECREVQPAGTTACHRVDDGYGYELMLHRDDQGRLAALDLDVDSDVRSQVLDRWTTELAAVLGKTAGSGGAVRDWLTAHPRVAGADVAVVDLALSYRADLHAYSKEVFGYVGSPCNSPDVISFCR